MKFFWLGLGLLALSVNAQADFFNSHNGEWKMGPYGPYYEENDWPEWTPMYWMEEMANGFDDNENDYGGYYGDNRFMGGYPGMLPYGAGFGYAPPLMPYAPPVASPYASFGYMSPPPMLGQRPFPIMPAPMGMPSQPPVVSTMPVPVQPSAFAPNGR